MSAARRETPRSIGPREPDRTLISNLEITAACVADATAQVAQILRRQPAPVTESWRQELAVVRAYLARALQAQERMRTSWRGEPPAQI